MMPGLSGGSSEMEGDLKGDMFINAAKDYTAGSIQGQYIALSDQMVAVPGSMPLQFELSRRFPSHEVLRKVEERYRKTEISRMYAKLWAIHAKVWGACHTTRTPTNR